MGRGVHSQHGKGVGHDDGEDDDALWKALSSTGKSPKKVPKKKKA